MGTNLETFSKQVKEAIRRAAELRRRAAGLPGRQQSVAEQALEDLQVTLEQLRVAEEELRVQSEHLMAASEEAELERTRYRELFEFAPDGYLVTDKEGMIREANRAATAIFGLERKRLLAKPLTVYIAPEYQKTYHSELTRLIEGGTDETIFEALLHPRRGQPFYASLKAGAARDHEGRLTGLRWIVRDITEQRRAADELRALNARLERQVTERTSQLESAGLEVMRLTKQTEPTRRLPLENSLLSVLAEQDYDRMRPNIEEVPLPLGEILYRPDDPIDYIYFPTAGMISLVSSTEEGGSIEVGMVGNDGMIGLPLFLGANKSPFLITVQIAGKGLRMRADMFDAESARPGSMHSAMLRYAYVMLTQLTQSVVCNRFHSIDERFCRWLLMAQDCAGENDFALTQEFISQMLGVRRSGVTVAAGLLQERGLIKYTRGHITILDKKGIEATSCECYRIVKEERRRLLGI